MKVGEGPSWPHMASVVGRSLLVGAVGGALGGGLLFFVFGVIGFTGAPLSSRLANGWRALLDLGLTKGLVVGAAIAVGLVGLIAVWGLFAGRVHPRPARPWLALLAALLVIVFNLEWIRSTSGWDWAGIATVLGMSFLVSLIVWLVAPWVLSDWDPSKPQRRRRRV